MRVPLYIVIPLCLLTVAIVWMVGTHDKDFMTPPTEAKLENVKEEWLASQPETIPSNFATPLDENDSNKEDIPTQVIETEVEPPKALLPTGDLKVAPSLSEYGTLGSEGSDAIIRLAEHLETEQSPSRALLAWERVLDITQPTAEQRDLAVKAIQRLSKELPPWNTDPSADIQLVLNAGSRSNEVTMIKNAVENTAKAINQSSGYILNVDTEVNIAKPGETVTPLTPIALWFTLPAKSETDTAPISITVDLTKPELIDTQVKLGIYKILQANLASKTSFTPLPAMADGDLALQQITRLMWRELAKNIK